MGDSQVSNTDDKPEACYNPSGRTVMLVKGTISDLAEFVHYAFAAATNNTSVKVPDAVTSINRECGRNDAPLAAVEPDRDTVRTIESNIKAQRAASGAPRPR
jgi:hypothetical protein